MAAHNSRKRPARGALAPRLAVAGALVGLLTTGLWTQRASTTERLTNALLEDRFTLGRLSGQLEWGKCTPVSGDTTALLSGDTTVLIPGDTTVLVPRTNCSREPRRGTSKRRRIDRAANAIAKTDSSPAALRSLALLNLRFKADLLEDRLAAVGWLGRAVAAAPNDAGLLNDLAVAYLALAELDPKQIHMMMALETVMQATEVDSLHLPARFNYALILQLSHVIGRAERAWTQYLKLEQDPQWQADAKQRLAELRRSRDTTSWMSLVANPPAAVNAAATDTIRVRVAQSLQAAREAGFPLLGAWGRAALEGDTMRTRQLLDLAREIGDALTADRSVALAVGAIDNAGTSHRLRSLAHGHVALGESFRLHEHGKYDRAQGHAEKAEMDLRAGNSPAARWAVFYQAGSRVNQRDYDGAARLLKRLIAETDSLEPALLGKSIWGLGLIELRNSRFATAENSYRTAAPYIATAGEVENKGTIAVLIAEALMSAGQHHHADTTAYRALRVLSPFRLSKYLSQHLNIVAANIRAAGLSRAALEIETEAIEVASARQREGIDSARQLALFYSARARDHTALANWHAAEADVDSARRWTDSISKNGERLRAIVQMTRGQVMRVRHPAQTLALLDSAVQVLQADSNELYLPMALYELARLEIDQGQLDKARKRLARAMDLVTTQRDSFRRPEDQITFSETVEDVFDIAVELEVSAHEPAAAFAIMERGRVVARAGSGDMEAPHLARIRAALRDDRMLLVEYALLADRMVIWTAARGRLPRQHVVSVSRDSIHTLVGRLGENSPESAWGKAAGAPLETLFRLLIRPLQPELAGIDQLTIVPDRELYGAPFAALWDAGRQQYLIEGYTLRIAHSAAFYVDAAGRSVRLPDNPTALVVGNPKLTREQEVDLLPLDGARREAESVAALYPNTRLLTGLQAGHEPVRQELQEHHIFHFAGHAVLNAEQPGESYLALAGDGSADGGLMRAREIPDLSLSNLQVVVLSACSTLGQRATRTGPAAGLAYSFLRAGVPATVSTLWDVSDSNTTPLLAEFHRQLVEERVPPAEALQEAQRAMMETLSPRVWAAFVYTGP